MNTILFLVLRRMRVPLLALSSVYAVATLGLTLIPGVDDQGETWHMDFFHAFYFVSFMGSTIGFGEIPYEFSGAQRMWVLISIYLTVIGWVYAIGALITLVQDPGLRKAFTERRFHLNVRDIRERFYLVCGYGDTGSTLVAALEMRAIRSTVLDIKQERINLLNLENYPIYVPGLCADAAHPDNLLQAGVRHPKCAGVVALTDQNKVNLHVAITAKVLNPRVKVICRADSHEVEANMDSFGTEHIIDPFDAFADHLAIALYSPCQYLLVNWLSRHTDRPLEEPIYPPRGPWVLCGYGRFGRAVYKRLREHGVPVTVIDASPEFTDPPRGTVFGIGTEACTLREAGIENAVGVVAGTDDDSNNLSIIMTARMLKPGLFVVVRQNLHFNEAIFESARADVVMECSRVVADTIRALLTIPLLEDFLRVALEQDDRWACALISRLAGLSPVELVPEVWELRIDLIDAFAVQRTLAREQKIRLRNLTSDVRDRERHLNCIPLLIQRGRQHLLLPDEQACIQSGDRLLFAGSLQSRSRMEWNLQNEVALTYVRTGRAYPQTYAWKWISRVLGRREQS